MTASSPQRKAKTLEMLKQYRENPSPRLRNRLVEMNMGLVRKEAHHWKNQCRETFDDLMQIGSIGLIQAVERFDVGRGLAFSSFALPYIRGEIQHYLRDKSPTMRVPRRWYTLLHQHKKVSSGLRQDLGRNPSEAEMRQAMGLNPEEWHALMLARQSQMLVSLDAPVRQSEEDSQSLGDMVPDSKYASFQLVQEDRLRLKQAMMQLEERTRQILEFVFLHDLSQKETAKHLQISPVTVSRQVSKGVKQLTKILGDEEQRVNAK
ncbi:MAG: RNA polymerase sigma factor SigF [Cyanobacteria bacterium J06639_1]